MPSKYLPKDVERPRSLIARLAGLHREAMIRIISEIAHNPEESASDRLKAAGMLLDRSDGKPHQSVAIEDERLDASPEDLKRRLEELRAKYPELVAVNDGNEDA